MILPADDRVIVPDADQYNATLVRRVDQTDEIAYFWIKVDEGPPAFEPGQYMTTGVFADGKLWQRPYSVASPPPMINSNEHDAFEFYVRRLPLNRFTRLLWRLPVGHRMRVIGPKGRFVLEPDDARDRLFISTGTGVAPFVSMIRSEDEDRSRRTIVLHGCSYVDELGYRNELESLQWEGARAVTYVPTISRPNDPRNAGWSGRTGRAEHVIRDVIHELNLSPDRTVAYLCGNPEMVVNAEALLAGEGFPGTNVKTELYWPAGRTATAEPTTPGP